MADRRRSTGVAVACGALGLLAVVAAAVQGQPTFSGPRWVIDWSIDPGEPPAAPPASGDTASPFPFPTDGAEAGRFPLGQILFAVIVIVTAVIVALLVRRWLARRARFRLSLREVGALSAANEPLARPAPQPEPEPETVRRGVDVALRQLDDVREPGDAIMKAWLGLQQTAEESGIRRSVAETATEFTARILSRVRADDDAVRTLLSLYLRTRFGDHPVTAADVGRARAALEALAASWDDRAGSRR